MTSVAFQSILRKQIRKLPNILKSVKIIQYYSIVSLATDHVAAVPRPVERLRLQAQRVAHVRRLHPVRRGSDRGWRVPGVDLGSRRAGKLYKARSRLDRRQILQVNTRWKALAEIFTMHSFALL